VWSATEILDACLAALRDASAQIEFEQAVRGLDALREVELHPILAEGLQRSLQSSVLREVPYPAAQIVRDGARPKRSERERCDLVVLPQGARKIRDSVEEARRLDAAANTLFGATEERAIETSADASPEDCFWLEVKAVGQHVVVDGAARANRGYSSELRQAVASDVAKLAQAPQIAHGAMLLVLFAESERVASHDWRLVADQAAGIENAGWQRHNCMPINDRIGNHVCLAGLIPIRKS